MAQSAPALAAEAIELLDALPERILVCSLDGQILHVPPAAEGLIGTRGAELVGRSLSELLSIVDGEPASRASLGQLRERGADAPAQVALKHARGVHLWIELVGRVARIGGRDLWLVSLRDRAAELPQSRETEAAVYRSVFECAPVGIFHVDPDSVITAANEAFAEIIGSPRRVLVGLALRTLPDQNIICAMEKALLGEITRYEGTYRSATGGKTTEVRLIFAPIMAERRVSGVVGIVSDVTQQKESERALKRSLAALDDVMENAPDAIVVHQEGRFALVNSRAVEMLGYDDAGQLLGVPVSAVIHPTDGDTVNERLRAIGAGSDLRPYEYRMVRRDGSDLFVEVKSIAFEHEGRPAVLVFGRDVTGRRKLEMQLQQADRLASVGTLAAGVAHEINNPLGYVMMTAELLERRIDAAPPADLHEHLKNGLSRILEGCERMRVIVRDLSAFSRRSEEAHAPVDVVRAVSSAVNMVRHTVRHKARLEVSLPNELPRVRGDEARLTQVFVNLLVNSAQAIPEGRAAEHVVRVEAQATLAKVVVQVRDDGEGMPLEVQRRVFDPFFTTKAPGVGSGLGLAICHGIVRSHGGSISIDSAVGRGTTVTVELPAAGRLPSVAPERRPSQPRITERGRVLVIDDEAAFADSLRDILSDMHTVTVARSGRAGVELLLDDDSFDLVLCDVMMPDISGLGVLDELARRRPSVCARFVFMTGGAVTDTTREMLELVDRPVLEKPFTREELDRVWAGLSG